MVVMCSNDLQVDLLFSRYDIDGKQRVTRMAWKTTPLWEKVMYVGLSKC
ncbi:hypothetical protein HanXRQr2_Chr01g0030471 [Helianthus annuus]|uniref:Uncharacterized protein n=1 Tax=Helianthus annuus TaxID=4232 RepID=A0A9K3P2X5_HELAN|nr:hypothetical protein HanXRQr2_Chr01g0030471 [Helianthus annuus]